MSRNLIQFRAALLDMLGDSSESPSIYTNEELLDRWIITACEKLDLIVPDRATYQFSIDTSVYIYNPPASYLDILKITVKDDTQEYPLSFIYDGYNKKVVILDFGTYNVVTNIGLMYYTKAHTQPTETQNSNLTNRQEDAVLFFACISAIEWLTMQLISQNRGVMQFKIGLYEERNAVQSVDAIDRLIKYYEAKALKVLDADGSYVGFTDGNKTDEISDDFSKPVLTLFGYDGSTLISQRNYGVPSRNQI